ncbi:MAG: HIT family protein [Nanoarchaeota archaeon]|nr:HIT family protein [Nanoarchaeota archaeon]MBU1644418.1 HIT family protein [Nanoarchaeota archaeon]MBU1977498.1 HIT family protein [Nanoarchaeota archaeon]
MKCEHCDIVDRNTKAQILYEDEEVLVAVKDVVTTPGQITVFPREHFTILEMVPNKILQKCSIIANKVGAAVFEALGAQGTNIIIQNGLGAGQKVPHFSIEVIPRRESDGLNFQWQPKHLAEDEIDLVLKLLKEEADKINLKEELKKERKEVLEQISKNGKEVTVKDPETKTEMKVEQKNKEDYLLKSLRRIP